MDNNEAPLFDEPAWRAVCEEAANAAGKHCGSSHDVYVQKFSGEIEAAILQLPDEHRGAAMKVAREWDYATPEELTAERQWNAEHGYCSHGIELGCCPAGCGSGPDD